MNYVLCSELSMFINRRRSQSRLQEEREALLKRLVQAEADSVSSNRELALLHGSIRTLKAVSRMKYHHFKSSELG